MTAEEKKRWKEHKRLIATRRVTVTARSCECAWCSGGPRRVNGLLLNYSGK